MGVSQKLDHVLGSSGGVSLLLIATVDGQNPSPVGMDKAR